MLEVVFTLVIVIALLLFIGVSPETIFVIFAVVILGLVALAMLLFVLFFLITDISLLFRKRVKGKFVRVDDTERFDHAVYNVDNQEYSCLFPAESFGRKRIYHENQLYLLLIPRNPARRSAYDKHSLITIAVGTMFSLIFVGLLIIGYFLIRSNI